ncbi:NUDIX hydrolase [Cuniculiplasma sp. SKW4]|uniref:NUDIX hydrolase n=1 Tax=Cuniculiplasma sp. SKW4 TaxID=3400171 RepID=UPI003FD625F9
MRLNASVAVCLFHGNVILMKRRKREGDPWSGDISFPGGFLKEGESFRDAAKREFEEETGINRNHLMEISEMDFFHPVRFKEMNVKPFIFKTKEMFPVKPNDEMIGGGWYDIHKLHLERDQNRGEFFQIDDIIIWGLTFRILKAIIIDEPELLE